MAGKNGRTGRVGGDVVTYRVYDDGSIYVR